VSLKFLASYLPPKDLSDAVPSSASWVLLAPFAVLQESLILALLYLSPRA